MDALLSDYELEFVTPRAIYKDIVSLTPTYCLILILVNVLIHSFWAYLESQYTPPQPFPTDRFIRITNIGGFMIAIIVFFFLLRLISVFSFLTLVIIPFKLMSKAAGLTIKRVGPVTTLDSK